MHNGKKKTAANVLAGYIAVPTTGRDISNSSFYPDEITAFAGYAKRDKGDGNFELLRQYETSVSISLAAGLAAGTYTITLNLNNERFIFSSYQVSYIQAGVSQVLTLNDLPGTNTIMFKLPTSTGAVITNQIIPKAFSGNQIQITISSAIGAAEFIFFTLFGWKERI